jgi:hypothetical protein
MKVAKVTAIAAIVLLSSCIVSIPGCGSDPVRSQQATSQGTPKPSRNSADNEEADELPAQEKRTSPKQKFQPIVLGDEPRAAKASSGATKSSPASENRSQEIVTALQPFQILLGQWRWITNKKFDGKNKSGEDLEWVWDFKHDPNQPALTAKSSTHPYVQQLWFSFVPEDSAFQATLASIDGPMRDLRGTWVEDGEPKDESDGKRTQHTYKLQLTQVSPADGDQWELQFSQLDNDQYLMTLARKSATGRQFSQQDVVRQQRLGTSFAVADSDNPGPKCIISGGLGSMSVTYKGKSYPVCCSGCAAAFNDDPERWLAKLAEREKQK